MNRVLHLFSSQESENNETNLKNPVSYNSPSNNPAIVSNKDTSFHENQIRKSIVPSLKIHGANGTEIEHSPGNSSNKKEIKGILKPGGPCARVILSSDNSGMEFNSRCLRLYKNEEQHIGRFSKFGGERPDGVIIYISKGLCSFSIMIIVVFDIVNTKFLLFYYENVLYSKTEFLTVVLCLESTPLCSIKTEDSSFEI